ncbi:MAG: DUF350 domain-containing protein [Bacteroidia bacterium]
MNILEVLSTLTYIAIAFVLFFIGKIAFGLFNKNINVNRELVDNDNVAFSTSMVGYYAGLITALGGAIIGPSFGMLDDMMNIGIYGLLAIVLLNISAKINDKLVFSKFFMSKEILTDRNLGTGIIEAANYFSTGLIIYGAVIGEGGGIITAVAFWAIAQVLFFAAAKVYNLITPYDIHDEIEKDNVAVGIGYAGALIAIAFLIKTGIEGDFESWFDHLLTVGIDVSIGFVFLPLARFLTDKILLPTRNLTDEIVNQEHPNVGAALIEAFAYIGGAVLISWTL